MKKLILTSAFVAALALTGCGGGGTPAPQGTKMDIDEAQTLFEGYYGNMPTNLDPIAEVAYYDYESKVSKKYREKNKNKNGSGSRYPSYYNYYDDDFDGYDYSDYTWEQWKNLDNDKEKCTCDFCETSSATDKVVDFYMPDGEKFHICELCLEDMEAEIKKAKQLLLRV